MTKSPKPLAIGKLAAGAGTRVETVRFYERIGLLPKPDRTAGNYRSYSRSHAARLNFIRRARDLGFSLDMVRALLKMADQKDQDCAEVDAIARQHLAEVERKLTDLRAMRHELKDLINGCSRGSIAKCQIIQSLGPTEDDDDA